MTSREMFLTKMSLYFGEYAGPRDVWLLEQTIAYFRERYPLLRGIHVGYCPTGAVGKEIDSLLPASTSFQPGGFPAAHAHVPPYEPSPTYRNHVCFFNAAALLTPGGIEHEYAHVVSRAEDGTHAFYNALRELGGALLLNIDPEEAKFWSRVWV